MKKIFTLKTLALGVVSAVALSASATPAEILKVKPAKLFSGKVEMAQKIDVSKALNMTIDGRKTLNTSDKAVVRTVAKAPAKRAEATYGEWEPKADGIYTYAQMLSLQETLKYSRRFNTANNGEFQVAIDKWGLRGEGTTLTFSVKKFTVDVQGDDNTVTQQTELVPTMDQPVLTGATGKTSQDGPAYPVYMATYATFLRVNKDAGNITDAQWTYDQIAEFEANSAMYDESTGEMMFYPIYFLYIDNKPSTMGYPNVDDEENPIFEYYQMLGNGYKDYNLDIDTDYGYYSHEKDAKTGTYTVPVAIHDNAKVLLRVASSANTAAMSQMLADYKANKMDDLTEVTKDGTVTLPVSNYAIGRRYVLAVVYNTDDAEPYGVPTSAFITRSDVDYYSVGDAEFSDLNLAVGINSILQEEIVPIDLDDVYTTTVPAQASASKPGMYRLIRPYKDMYEAYLAATLDYLPSLDIVEFECNNFEKVNIRPSNSGFVAAFNDANNEAGYVICSLQLGSTNQFANSANTDSKELWGKYADGAVSFPAPTAEGNQWHFTEASAISFAFADYDLDTEVTSEAVAEDILPMPYPDYTTIKFKVAAGVQNVAVDRVDENAPVEYFNLQGIRVVNPEAGQLLIKKQGAKTQKVVIR